MPYAPTVDTGRYSFYTPSVKDFGAKGDGVSDDLPAINAALAALPTGGGTVYFPPGTYAISSTIVINSDNVQLIGAGWSSIIQPLTGLTSNPLIHVVAPGGAGVFRFGIAITDLHLYGNNRSGVGGIQLDSTYHALLDHLRIDYFPATAVYLNGSSNTFGAYSTIRKCSISNGGAGIGIATNAHEWNTIEDCLITWYSSTGGKGVYITGSDNRIINVGFDECDVAVHLYFAHNNSITACGFDRGLTSFIRLQGAVNSRVIGNTFNVFSGTGVQSQITVDSSNNSTNLIADNICEPSDGWTNFVNEASGTGGSPGNLYTNNYVGSYGVVKQSGSIWRGNTGYNPVGALTAPTMPASGTPYTNTFGLDCTVNIYGGTVTNISVAGSSTGLTLGSFHLLAGQTITVTYSVAPTWTWFGE